MKPTKNEILGQVSELWGLETDSLAVLSWVIESCHSAFFSSYFLSAGIFLAVSLPASDAAAAFASASFLSALAFASAALPSSFFLAASSAFFSSAFFATALSRSVAGFWIGCSFFGLSFDSSCFLSSFFWGYLPVPWPFLTRSVAAVSLFSAWPFSRSALDSSASASLLTYSASLSFY